MLGLLLLGTFASEFGFGVPATAVLKTSHSDLGSQPRLPQDKQVEGGTTRFPSKTTSLSSDASVTGKTLEDHLRGISGDQLQAALETAGEHGKAGKDYALSHLAAVAQINQEAEEAAQAEFQPKIQALLTLARETDDAIKQLYSNLQKAGAKEDFLQNLFGQGNDVLKRIAFSMKSAAGASADKQTAYADFDKTHAGQIADWEALSPEVKQKALDLNKAGAEEKTWFGSKAGGKDLLAKGKADGSAVTAAEVVSAFQKKLGFDRAKEQARLEAEQEKNAATSSSSSAYPSGAVAEELIA